MKKLNNQNTMKKISFLGLVMAFFMLVACSESASSQVTNMGVDEFVKTYKSTSNAQLLDVRTPNEWAQGKLKNSATIDYNSPDFAQKISSLDKKKPVFVYCAVGGRSARAAQVLEKNGFKVYNLTGAGYAHLAEKGL